MFIDKHCKYVLGCYGHNIQCMVRQADLYIMRNMVYMTGHLSPTRIVMFLLGVVAKIYHVYAEYQASNFEFGLQEMVLMMLLK